MTLAEGGGIFVSYRRQESSHLAGRLYDRLADRFGEDQVFIDVDIIEPGVDFAEEIFRAVTACKVLLAVIGPTWLTATDERGRRRLDVPDDIVRLEIEAALVAIVTSSKPRNSHSVATIEKRVSVMTHKCSDTSESAR